MRVYPLFLQGFKSGEIVEFMEYNRSRNLQRKYIWFDGYNSHVERDRKNKINLIFIRISVPFILVSSILDERNGNIRKISTLKFATGDLFDLKASENRYWTCNRPLWDLCLSNPFLGVEIGLRRDREREIFNFRIPFEISPILFAISSSSRTTFHIFLKLCVTFHVTSLPESLLKKKKKRKIFERTFSKKWLSFIQLISLKRSWCKVLRVIIRLVPSNVYITGWKIYTRVLNANAR